MGYRPKEIGLCKRDDALPILFIPNKTINQKPYIKHYVK